MRVKVKVAQSCPTLCDPVDSSLPSSSVHGILQARILGWLPFPSPGDLSKPGIEPRSPALQADCLLSEKAKRFNFNQVSSPENNVHGDIYIKNSDLMKDLH